MANPNPMTIAATWASLLYQARHRPDAADELAEAARILRLALGDVDLSVHAGTSGVEVNGTRLSESVPGARDLHEQLIVHGVRHVVIPASVPPEDLLVLTRALAAYPGVYPDWRAFLQAIGPARDRIQLAHAGDDLTVIRYEEPEPTLEVGNAPSTPAAAADLNLYDDTGLILPPLELMSSPVPRTAPKASSGAKSDEAHRFDRLVHAGRSAVDAGDTIALLGIAREFLDAADSAATEASARVLRLELRRLLTHRHIAQVAKLAALGKHRETALNVLERIGPEATEVLMELLVDAESLAERRGYFTALTRMAEGTDIIVNHLDHPAWYVVRNAAELCGELRLERAVPRLAFAARHADERVRKSVAGALLRIASPSALEPLAKLLKDPSFTIRLHVLGNLDGGWGRPLAMSLATLLETEDHPDVVREALKALGRIGSPDAIQALQRAATGGNRRLSRRQRLHAVESLGLAGPAAVGVLRSLAEDQDREIAESAIRALEAAPV
jgi:HEAT repeat protein